MKNEHLLNINFKLCNDFEEFTDLMDEAKYSVKEIFINNKKHDKRKTNYDDFMDLFDNNVHIKYSFTNDKLDIWIGN